MINPLSLSRRPKKLLAGIASAGIAAMVTGCINPVEPKQEVANGASWQPIVPNQNEWSEPRVQPAVENPCEGVNHVDRPFKVKTDTIITPRDSLVKDFPWMARTEGPGFNSTQHSDIERWQSSTGGVMNRWNSNGCDARLEELRSIYPKHLSHWDRYYYLGLEANPSAGALAASARFREAEDDCIAAIDYRATNANGGVILPMTPNMPVMKDDEMYDMERLLSRNPERWRDAHWGMQARGANNVYWDGHTWLTVPEHDKTLDSNSLSGDYTRHVIHDTALVQETIYLSCPEGSYVCPTDSTKCHMGTTSIRENPRVIPGQQSSAPAPKIQYASAVPIPKPAKPMRFTFRNRDCQKG